MTGPGAAVKNDERWSVKLAQDLVPGGCRLLGTRNLEGDGSPSDRRLSGHVAGWVRMMHNTKTRDSFVMSNAEG
jgi:hypothetical protein